MIPYFSPPGHSLPAKQRYYAGVHAKESTHSETVYHLGATRGVAETNPSPAPRILSDSPVRSRYFEGACRKTRARLASVDTPFRNARCLGAAYHKPPRYTLTEGQAHRCLETSRPARAAQATYTPRSQFHKFHGAVISGEGFRACGIRRESPRASVHTKRKCAEPTEQSLHARCLLGHYEQSRPLT